jgi:hypothetical protein
MNLLSYIYLTQQIFIPATSLYGRMLELIGEEGFPSVLSKLEGASLQFLRLPNWLS